MQSTQTWLIARDDTFLGVCQGLGEDFGFNPNWLRIAFAVPLLLNPVAAIALYLGVGSLVLLTRLLAPNPRRAMSAEPAVESGEPQGELALDPATNNDNNEELAAAA